MTQDALRRLAALALCETGLHCWGRAYGQDGAPIACARCGRPFPPHPTATAPAVAQAVPTENYP